MGFTIEHEGMFSLSEIEIIQAKFIILADPHIVLKIDSIGGHIDAAARNAIPQQVLRNNLGGLIQDWSNPFIVSLIFDFRFFMETDIRKKEISIQRFRVFFPQ